MSKYRILSNVNYPEDLKNLDYQELKILSEEIRDFLVDNVSKTGGHFSSNLGVVELTIALHRIFNSPKDKFIFDVGHQCYPHKILTGRKDQFPTNRQFGGMSGFTRRYESQHDFVDAGHSSTSISSALGILLGEELQGKSNYIIPIIGDASLTGGMAYEALNHIGHLGKKIVIILNDNNMAIDDSVGAISSMLSTMTTTKSYQVFRRFADWTMLHIPLIGKQFYAGVMRWKKSVKTFFYKSNIFTDLGLKYIGPIDGHNLKELEKVLTRVKKLDQPVLIHVITKKGKGYKPAEDNPGPYHGVKPFNPAIGVVKASAKSVSYTQAFSNALMMEAEKDSKIVAITAAMMSGTGLSPFFKKYPTRSFDVGITEEHAVTMAAGIAISGMKPIVAIYSTFIQRSIDQIIHDVAIPGLPVVFTLDRAGIVPADGEAHQGLFDIPLLKSVPGMTLLAPSTQGEMEMMLSYSLKSDKPCAIRYSKDSVLEDDEILSSGLVEGQGVLYKNNSDILVITYGEMLRTVKNIDHNIDIYSLRFISPFDKGYIEKLINGYNRVLVVEDGIIKGGVGEEIKSIDSRVEVFGVDSSFLTHGTREELKKMCHIDSVSLSNKLKGIAGE